MKLSFLSAFCFFVFSFFFQPINAQNRDAFEIDSLLKEAAKAKHDTTRYTAFEYAANIYQYSNPDSALFFHTKALQLAIALKDEIKRGRSILEIGRDHFLSGNNEKALQFYNEALQIVEKEIPKTKNRSATHRAKKFKGNCLFYLGTFYKQQNDYVKSIENYNSALTVARELFDTLQQIRVLGTTGMIYFNLSENKKALLDLQESTKLAKLINNRVNLAVLYGNMGLVYNAMGDSEKAIEHYNKAMNIDQEAGNTIGVTRHLSNIVTVYRVMGNYAKALEFAFRALKMAEQDKNTINEGIIFGDIAVIYTLQGQLDKAISFYIKALKKCKEADYTKGTATQYLNLGIAYMTQAQHAEKNNITLSYQKYALALSYYTKADSLFTIMKDLSSQSNALVNMAIIYGRQGNTDKAIAYLEKAVEICIQTEDKFGESIASGDLGSFYAKKGNYKEAEKNLLLSLKLAEEIGAVNEIKVAHEFLVNVYDKTNKPALAYLHYKAFINYRDSLTSVENTRASVEQELKFNFEKKTVADSIKVAADKKITMAQLKQEKVQRYSLYGGLLLVALFALFMVQRFRLTNKQKKIIESQKHMIEEKQKEMLDSIHYAKRIQRALLTNEKYIQRKMKELI